jgi:hypothetical protein
VYDATGRPVVLPVDATFIDLRDAVGAGRYRLDPIDASGHIDATVKTACTGYVQPVEPANEGATASARGKAPVRAGSDDLVVELARTNIKLAEMVVGSIPAILAATSGLITAADGANLTTRKPVLELPPPREPDPDEYDDEVDAEEVEPQAKSGWVNSLMEALAPVLIGLVKNGSKLPGGIPLEALVDWRKARPPTVTEASVPASPPAETSPSEQAGVNPTAHVLAIWQLLSSEEQQYAEALVGRLTGGERTAWIAELTTLSVSDAVRRVRHILRPYTTAATAAQSGIATGVGHAGSPAAAAPVRESAPTSAVSGQVAPRLPGAAITLGSIFPARAGSDRPAAEASTSSPNEIAAPSRRAPTTTTPDRAASAAVAHGAQGTAVPPVGPVAPSTTTEEHDVRALEGHLLQIWGSLSADERLHAQKLMERLSAEQRSVWVVELGSLSVPEAVERVRATVQLTTQAPNHAAATDASESQVIGSTINGAS